MRKLFILFLLLIQSFFLCAGASEISNSAKNFNTPIQYIQTKTTHKKFINVDFKNYENAIISLNSKSETFLALKDDSSTRIYLTGFYNNSAFDNYAQYLSKTKHVYPEFYNISQHLKNEIPARAP
ncbi:hypothetical protein J6I39_02070 [bacterium]|nr:hypothetical protein [bacterium]